MPSSPYLTRSQPRRSTRVAGAGRLEWRHQRAGSGGRPKIGVVLGAGGLVGLAYHAGVLRALEAEGGFVPAQADLLVGTSAGSVVSAYLRAGWTTEDFWQVALGTHPSLAGICSSDPAEARRELMTPAYHSPLDMARRAVGSAVVAGKCLARINVAIPRAVTHAFPSGLYEMTAGRRRFHQELPRAWPSRKLWLVAMDLEHRQRVVFGREGTPDLELPEAVEASCAIPGVYTPVQVDGMTLVDGGAHSSTNLDLAVEAGCDVVVVVAPMAYDRFDPPSTLTQFVRRAPMRTLNAEIRVAEAAGCKVVVVTPSAREVEVHGYNMMRPEGLDQVARSAYETTARAVRMGIAAVLEEAVAAV